MKMNPVKKMVTILAALSVLLTVVLPVFAAEKKSKGVPVIDVDGIFSETLYLNAGTSGETALFPPDATEICKTLSRLAWPDRVFTVDNFWDAAGNAIIPNVKALLEPLSCKADGTSKYNVTVKDDWSLPKNYHFDSLLEFGYDWRMDYMDAAKTLNDYICFLKEQTGCEKVALIPNSMGGIVTAAYLQQFGASDIDTVVMRSSAFEGVSLVGELFTKKIAFNKKAILRYCKAFIKDDEQDKIVSSIFSALDKTGVWDLSVSVANGFFGNQKDKLYQEALHDVFCTMPGMWELVPDKYYETAKKMMLDPVKNAGLIKKIDYYHYNVQSKMKIILQNTIHSGTKVAILSNYDLQGVPVTTNANAQTDFLIDTVYTSAGATCAPLGKTFGINYSQAVACGHNHISPDRIIDASTCMFPEYTWFIKDMIHTNFNDDYDRLVQWILNYDGQPDVFDNIDFPQFMQLNKTENTLSPILAK